MAAKTDLLTALEAPEPTALRAWFRSQTVFAPLRALPGIAERLDYHPEGDAGVHLELCIEQAWKQCHSAEERVAVLLHDIGKSVTGRALPNPTDIALTEPRLDEEGRALAQHIGHDKIGAAMMPKAFETLNLPAAWLPLATAVALYHQRLHQIEAAGPKALIALVRDIRQTLPDKTSSEAIASVVRCARADHFGRGGAIPQRYLPGELLEAAERVMAEHAALDPARLLALEHRKQAMQAQLAKHPPATEPGVARARFRALEQEGFILPEPFSERSAVKKAADAILASASSSKKGRAPSR
jgi:hypothetical protein